MKGYSSSSIFLQEEIKCFNYATELVGLLVESPKLRCHELARAVGRVLGLPYQDGYYGFVDHTWLWTERLQHNSLTEHTRLGFPNILDVYSVGSLPMVRLVDGKHTALPHVGWAYRPGKDRSDIDQDCVTALYHEMMQGRKQ